VTAIIQAIEESQTGIPDEIATALISQVNARCDARQATVPAADTPVSTITTGDPSQATAP
jgi:hypothetical protein